MEGEGFAEVLKEFDPKLAEQSSAALGNAMTSITDTIIKGSADSAATIAKLQSSIGAIDSTDPRKASQGIQEFITALEMGELGEAGKAAASTIKNDLTLQLASSFEGMTKGMSEQDADFVAAGIKRISEAAKSGDPGAYSAAIAQMNTEMNGAGPGFNAARTAFMKITKEAAMSTVAIAQQGVQQAIMNNLLEESAKLIDSMVTAMQKLTGAMESTLNIFDIFVSNTEKRVASLLSGEADFALDETVNPFENLDIEDLSVTGIPESITKAFREIESVGGTGAVGTLKGLETAPQFAQNLPDIMKKAVNEIETKTTDAGGKLQTQTAMLDIIRGQALAGGAAEGPILDAFMKDMEKTLTQARQGEGGMDAIKAALSNTGEIVDKFGGATQEVIDQLAAQFNAAKEIAQRASDIAKLQRDVQKRLREFDAQKSEIDQRVGEITGTRKGGLAEAQADLNTQIARQTGQAVSVGGRVVAGGVATGNVGELQARQTALQSEKARIEAARAVPGQSTNESLIGQLATVKAALEDTTGALSTLADDTTRLAAIESEIADLQSKQLAEQDALQGTFERLQGIQEKLASGDFKGAAEDRKAVRADFRAVEKLETGQQLTTAEMAKVLSGTLDPLLVAGGKTQEEIAKLKTQASVEARGVAIGGLAQLGINAGGFFQGVDQGAAIDAKKDEARDIGEQQKSAIEVMEDRVRQQSITEMDKLNTAVNELRIQMQMAAFSAEELRNADNVQRRDVKDFEAGAMRAALEEGGGVSTQIKRLSTREEQAAGAGQFTNVDVGGFVPAAAEGDLTKESTRKTAESQIDTELERLRPMTNLVTDDASHKAIQKEIDRLVKAKEKLADIEEEATKAREAQFEADKRAAKEQAIANIKAHEERIRQNQGGGGMGAGFTQPGGELGVVAPVATGIASASSSKPNSSSFDGSYNEYLMGSFHKPPDRPLSEEEFNAQQNNNNKPAIRGGSASAVADLQVAANTEFAGIPQWPMGAEGSIYNADGTKRPRQPSRYPEIEAAYQNTLMQPQTQGAGGDVQALGVQKMDSMLASVADPTAQATPEQRAEIEKHKATMGAGGKPHPAQIQKRLTSEQKAEQVRRVKAGLSPYDDDDPSIGGGGIVVSQAPDSLTATRTPQAQDMIERQNAQTEIDRIKKKRGDYQTYMGQQSDDETTRTAANWKRQADLEKRHGGGEALTSAELTELKVLNEGAGLTGVSGMAEKDREGGMQSVNVKKEGLRTFATGKFVGEEAEADKRDAERQKVLEERLAKPKVKTPRLDDSITRDMAALREEQARQGVGDGPIDVTKQIGFNKYNDPKDIAAKQREEGIAKYKASVPTKIVTDNIGNKSQMQAAGYGDESLLNKSGMMAGSQQTLASQRGINVQDLRGEEGTYRMGIEGDRRANAAVSAAIEKKRQGQLGRGEIDPMTGQLTQAGKDALNKKRFAGQDDAESKRKQLELNRAAKSPERKNKALVKLRKGELNKGNVQDYLYQRGEFSQEDIAKKKAEQEAAAATKGGGGGPQKPKQTATTLGEASSFYANQLTGGGAGGAQPAGGTLGPPNYRSGAHIFDGVRTPGAGGRPDTSPQGHYIETPGLPQPGAVGVASPQGMAGAGGAAGGIMGPDALTAMNGLAAALNGIADGIKIQDINVTLDQGNIMETIKNVVTDAVVAEISKLPGTGGSSDKGTLSSSNPPANTNGGQ